MPTDPVQLFVQLSKMRPFNRERIDLAAIRKFVTYFATLSKRDEDVGVAMTVTNNIHMAKDLLMVQADIVPMSNLTAERFKGMANNPLNAPRLAKTLHEVVHYAGILYTQFLTSQKDKLSQDDQIGFEEQITNGGPQSANISTLESLQSTLGTGDGR